MGTAKRERQKANRAARIQAAQVAQQQQEKRRSMRNIGVVVGIVAVVILLLVVFGRRDADDSDLATGESTNTSAPVVTPGGSTPDAGTATTPPTMAPGASVTGDTPCPNADGSSERTTKFEKTPPMCIDATKTYTALFDTTAGKVTVKLDAAKMPGTVNNFVVLSRYHYYDGTLLFRTDPSIDIIQGGAPTTNSPSDPGPGPDYKVQDEGGTFDFSGAGKGPFTYAPGQLIMARSAGPNSSGAQFFFSTGPNVKNLDAQGTYLLFGEVTEGLDVLQAIIATHVPGGSLGGAPNPAVTVNTVTITEA